MTRRGAALQIESMPLYMNPRTLSIMAENAFLSGSGTVGYGRNGIAGRSYGNVSTIETKFDQEIRKLVRTHVQRSQNTWIILYRTLSFRSVSCTIQNST
jgi:hypothetical protein